MSSLKFERREKPESAKLITQLVCYLLLENQKQLRIERFLNPNISQELVKAAIYKQYRMFFRYIGEVLSCLKVGYSTEDEFDDQWRTIYLGGNFYCGVDTINSIDPTKTKGITPIEPSPAHRNRLIRTMRLAQEIVEDVVRENEREEPPVLFFQSTLWPQYKSYYRKTYSNDYGLGSRTVQRDMRAVFSAVSQYLEMSEFRNWK